MKLLIKKDQDSKFFGGVKFKLEARTELDSHERELISKYKVHKEILLTKNTLTNSNITINDLIEGVEFKSDSIQEILKYETNVKQACKSFNTLISVMASFGGEYEIDCMLDEN